MQDPAFAADANKQKLEIELVTGEEMDGLISKLYKSSPHIVARAKVALGDSLRGN